VKPLWTPNLALGPDFKFRTHPYVDPNPFYLLSIDNARFTALSVAFLMDIPFESLSVGSVLFF
jgi:hypothetical protein